MLIFQDHNFRLGLGYYLNRVTCVNAQKTHWFFSFCPVPLAPVSLRPPAPWNIQSALIGQLAQT